MATFIVKCRLVNLIIIIIIIIIMAEMAVILRGLATSNEGDTYGLLFTASPLGLKFETNLQYMSYSVEKTLLVAWLDEKLVLI